MSDQFAPGYYKMRFGVGDYFSSQSKQTFFPFVEVCFCLNANVLMG